MFIPVGKLIIALIWIFWVVGVDSSLGQKMRPHDHSKMSPSEIKETMKLWEQQQLEEPKEEYFPTYSSTFDKVKDRGVVYCGTKDDFKGFSESYWDSDSTDGEIWVGFDVDICRAVAAAVLGDATAVEYVVVDGKTRFEYLIDGSIDVLSAATTYTFTRNVSKKLEFLPTTYYDGQGFITKKTLGVSSAKQMVGAKICMSSTGTSKKNIEDFFKKHFIEYIPVVVPVGQKSKDWYLRGECDMYGTDRSGLASNRTTFKDAEWHIILPEVISKEPLGPVVKYGDQKWSDIVRWTVYVLFIAEELEINSKNIDNFIEHIDPNIQRFMGELNGADHPHLGDKLGLSSTWAYDIIKQVGNYREIYERNVGKNTPLGLERGLNKLYKDGGLLYAPPLR
jgi:general L-amino acid transport system substrate-binding protein